MRSVIGTQPAFCATAKYNYVCSTTDPTRGGTINALDRTTAGYWSVPWQAGSVIGLVSVLAGAAVVLVVNEGPLAALNDAVVVAESALSATAISSVLSLAVGRPRPYLYGTSAPLSVRASGDAGLSFASSHVSVSAATVMATYMATRRLNTSSTVSLVVLGIGGAAVAFVGLGRVMGGEHFITDALGGAVVGTSVGILVPALHSSPVKIVPVVSDTQRGLAVVGVF